MMAFLFIALFVIKDFFQFLGQSLATQIGGYDFALWIDKEIGRNGSDAIDGCEFRVAAFQIRELDERGAEVFDTTKPSILLVIDGNGQYLEATVAETLKVLDDIRHFHSAGTAPTGPEVNEHVLALSAPFAKLVALPVGVCQCKIGQGLADLSKLQDLQPLPGLVHQGVVEIVGGAVDDCR